MALTRYCCRSYLNFFSELDQRPASSGPPLLSSSVPDRTVSRQDTLPLYTSASRLMHHPDKASRFPPIGPTTSHVSIS